MMAKKKVGTVEEAVEDARDNINDMIAFGNKLGKSQSRGDNWCRKAIPVLVNLSTLKKWLEVVKKEGTADLKKQVAEVEKPAKEALAEVLAVDVALRERVKEEHGGTDAVDVDGVGSLSFQEKWTYEVEDFNNLDDDLKIADHKTIMEEIRGGVREIPGLNVFTERVLYVNKPGGGFKE